MIDAWRAFATREGKPTITKTKEATVPARKRSHKRFTKVSVSTDTLARLQAVQDEILHLIDKGTIPDPGTNPEQINPNAKALSIDALINLLLDRRDQHKERARKSRKKKGAESV